MFTGGVRLIDYDGDGHPDVMASRAVDFKSATINKSLRILRTRTTSKGIELTEVMPISAMLLSGVSNEDFEAFEVGDVDGDGLEDIVAIQQRQFVIYRRKGKRPDVLTRVVDGVGAEARFSYATLADPTVYGAPPFSVTYKYPQREVSGPMMVVAEHAVSNGVTPTSVSTFAHRYEQAVEDIRGRGFLGFKFHEITEPARETTTRYEFDLSPVAPGTSIYPYVSIPVTEEVRVRQAGGPFYTKKIFRTYDRKLDEATGVYSPFAKTITIEENDWSSSSAVMTYKETTTQTVDNYGHVTESVTKLGNDDRYTQTRIFDIAEDKWLLDRLAKAIDVGEAQSLSERRTTSYRYDAQGGVQTVAIEPGDDTGSDIKPLTQPQPDRMKTLFVRFGRDANGQVNQIAYDPQLLPSKDERRVKIFYEGADQIFPTRVENQLGQKFRMAFHSGLGVRATIADPEDRKSELRYDTFGRLKEALPAGGDEQSVDYVGYVAPAANLKRPTLEVKLALKSGSSGRARLDNLNRAVSSVTYDRNDGRGVQSNTTYDAWGHVTKRSHPFFELSGPTAFDTFAYDNLGRPTRSVGADGVVRVIKYRGLQTDSYDADPSDPTAIRITSATDIGGRLLSSTQHAPATADSSARDLVMSYVFGPYGELSESIPLGVAGLKTTYRYDRRGRRLSEIDPTRGRHSYTYNVYGQLESEEITNASATATPETRGYAYDVLGRPLTSNTRDGETRFTWDTSPSGVGQLATAMSTSGVGTSFAYDAFGRLAKRTSTIGGEPFDVALDYDDNGHPRKITYPDKTGRGFAVEYVRGAHGALQSIVNASTKQAYWTSLEVDSAGLAINPSGVFPRVKLGNGIVSELAEDPAHRGRQLGTRATIGAQLIQGFTYESDQKRNLKHRRDEVDGMLETFDYDQLNRLHTWQAAGAKVAFDYDDAGSLRRQIHQPDGAKNITYAFGKSGGAGPYGVTAINGGAALTFDAEGNQLASPDGRITPNVFGLPKSIETTSGTHEFSYDAFGSRVRRKLGASEDVVTIDSLYERATKSVGMQVFRVFGPEGAVVEISRPASGSVKEVVRYLHRDNLGSVVGLTDETGKLVESRRYDPFGSLYQQVVAPNATPSALGFGGHRTDVDLGLIDMVGRVYSPKLARFLSADPLSDPGSTVAESNPYAYVLNNPASYVDPFGLDADWPNPGGVDPLPPPDELPPGPGIQPGNNATPYPTGDGSRWTLPAAPYNPVNQVDNRAAAASINYIPMSFSTIAGFSGERLSTFDDHAQAVMGRLAQRRWMNPSQPGRLHISISQLPPNRVFADRTGWGGFCDWVVDHPFAGGALIGVGVAATVTGVVVVVAGGTVTIPAWLTGGTAGLALGGKTISENADRIERSLGAASRMMMIARQIGANINSPTTRQLLSNLDMRVTDYIAKYRQASIRGKFPTDVLEMTIEEALLGGDSLVRKLLMDGRFSK